MGLLKPSSIFQLTFPLPPILPPDDLLSWWYAGDGALNNSVIGSPVTAWNDESPNAYDLTKAGAGTVSYTLSDPTFNNRGSVQFDGASYLFRAIVGGILATPAVFCHYAVISTLGSAQQYVYSEGNSGTTSQLLGSRQVNAGGSAGGNYRGDTSIPEVAVIGGDINDGGAHLITFVRISATGWALRVDGVQVATATVAPTTPTMNRCAIGCLLRTIAQTFFTGKIATVANYSSNNFSIIEPILLNHYGI